MMPVLQQIDIRQPGESEYQKEQRAFAEMGVALRKRKLDGWIRRLRRRPLDHMKPSSSFASSESISMPQGGSQTSST